MAEGAETVVDDDIAAWIGIPAAREVAAWAAGLGLVLEAERRLTAGLSGSIVGLVAAKSTRGLGDRRVVFKLNPDGSNTDEGDLHAKAFAEDPDFSAQHLVRLLFEPLTLADGSCCTLQEFAGGDRAIWQPLSSLTGRQDMTSSLISISRSMIEVWNKRARIDSGTSDVFLSPRVKNRFADGGLIQTWLSDEFGPGVVDADWLTFSASTPSVVRVNPCYLLRDEFDAPITQTLMGNSHGDLHVENVLLPVDGQPDAANFRLIDLAYFSGDRSISDDPANLLLSEIERLLASWSNALSTSLIEWVDTRNDGVLPVELVAVAEAWSGIEACGLDLATERGYAFEWRTQFWLSLYASALVLSTRDRLSKEIRTWFFELAAVASTKWLEMRKLVPALSDVTVLGPDADKETLKAQEVARRVTRTCSHFDGSVVSIALVPADALKKWSLVKVASAGWDAVIDFDPSTNEEEGPFRLSKQSGDAVKLLEPSQPPTWSRNATTWLAAAGLASVGVQSVSRDSFRTWRSRFAKPISSLAVSLATGYSAPLKIVVFGKADDYVRAVVDQLFDAFGERASVVIVDAESSPLLLSYEPTLEQVEANDVALALQRKPQPAVSASALSTVPGNDGRRVVLRQDDREFLEDGYELLHSLMALQSQSVDGVGLDFYSGRQITWFELESDVDLRRLPAQTALRRAVEVKLAKRSTDRHVFGHFPGAGGTTVARRLAWDLRDEYPVILASRQTNSQSLAERIELLARLTERKVLVVIEVTGEKIIEDLFDRLRSNSVAALLLLVSRAPITKASADASRVLPPMHEEEVRDFKRFFANMKPLRADVLKRIGSTGPETPVPFLYALTAFQEDFVGLADYVGGFLSELDDRFRPVVIVTALAHRYGATSVHASIFASQLGLPKDQPISLVRESKGKLDGLLLEERTGYWRTPHTLIAEQILRQTLAPQEGLSRDRADAWKMNLPHWAETLITYVSTATTGPLSTDSDELLQQVFIKREIRNDGDKARFSDLVNDLPFESRGRVFDSLTEAFPEEAHYWAHYSRWQSSELKDHPRARSSMEEALRLNSSDPRIWHMKGTNSRRELYDYMDRHRQLDQTPQERVEVVGTVQGLAHEAIDDYERADRLDDTSDYPLLPAAELCVKVIEWGRRLDSSSTYAAFLRKPSSAFFSDLLDVAEDRLDSIGEIQGDDQMSRRMRIVKARLEGLYDNYPAMIEGWRNILDNSKGSKTAIRVRLAKLYGLRNGGWSKSPLGDLRSAMELLNLALLDDPSDGRTVRAWLGAARHAGVSLSRAQEVVARWVADDNSRDALYYDYVLTALHALEGGLASADELEHKVQRMRTRSQDFLQRRTVYDWYRSGDELGQLVNKADVDWERRTEVSPPEYLKRVLGRVTHIQGPTRGTILLENNVEAFFAPSVAGMLAGRDVNANVTAVLGFTYDGIQAWSVTRASTTAG